MGFFKFLGNLLGGRRREEEEERARRVAAPAPTPLPKPVASTPSPTPAAPPVQQALRQMALPTQAKPAPEPIKKALNPTQPLRRLPKPTMSPSDKAEAVGRRITAEEERKNPIGTFLTKNNAAKNYIAPAVTGAAQATMGLGALGLRYLPGFGASDKISEMISGKRTSQRINDYAMSQREAVRDNSTQRIPDSVPLVGGQNPTMLASEAIVDPTNAIPVGKGLSLGRRVLAGAGIAGIGGLIQPAASEIDRLRNVVLSAPFGGIFGTLPQGHTAVPGDPDTIPRGGLIPKELPNTVSSEADQLLRRLNSEVQEQLLNRDLAQLPREIQEAISDIPTNERDTNLRDLDVPVREPVNSPPILEEPVIPTPKPPTIPQSPVAVDPALLRQLEAQNRELVGGARDTVLDQPTFTREPVGADALDEVALDPQPAPSVQKAIIEQKAKELAEEEVMSEPRLTPETTNPITTPDVAAEAAIPDAANALPENPIPVPPQALAEAEATPPPVQTAMAEAPAESFVANANKSTSIANTEAIVRETLNGAREDSRLNNDKIFAQVKAALGVDNPTPETRVKMYRAGTEDIQPGDHVTVDQKNAAKYQKQRPDSQIFEEEMTLKDLVRSGGLKSEFIYAPQTASAATPTIDPTNPSVSLEAPATRQQLNKMYDAKTDNTKGTIAHDADLQARADKELSALDDEALADRYIDRDTEGAVSIEPRPISGAQEIHTALTAANRLSEMGTEKSLLALQNIIDGITLGTRQAGQALSIISRLQDSLPPQVRANMTLAKINNIREQAGMSRVNDAEAKVFTDNLVSQFDQLSKARAALAEIKTDIGATTTPQTARSYLDAFDDANRAVQTVQGEINRSIDTIYPPKHVLEKLANFQRVNMLTSPAGRINDLISTSANAFTTLINSAVEAPISKLPLPSRKLNATQGTLFNRSLISGGKSGFKDLIAAYKGDVQADNIYSANQSYRAGQSNLIRAPRKGPWNRVKGIVTASVQAPTYLTKGIRDAELYRLAKTEAKAQGLSGDEAELFALKSSIEPSRDIAERAANLHEVVNNINDNALANAFGAPFEFALKNPMHRGVRALIQNAITPFVRFGATFISNSITKHNAISASVRAAKGLASGDAQATSKGLAEMITYGGATWAGLELAKDGFISETDAEGYAGGGPFLKLGNQYISLGIFGNQLGMQLALGKAIADAFNNEEGESDGEALLKNISQTTMNYAANLLNVTGAQGMLGEGNNLTADLGRAMDPNAGSFREAVPTRQLSRMFSQNIPAIGSDINALINSSPLNPTGEEALTRVENAEGKVDYGQTAINQVMNRVPGLSQMLPRNEGVAADNIFDRVLRGSHMGQAQQDKVSEEERLEAQSKELASRHIPDPYILKSEEFSTEVQRYRESDNFTIVAEALEHQYAMKEAEGASQKDLDKIQRDIDVARVAEKNAIVYKDLAMYYGGVSGIDAADTISNTEFKQMLDPDDELYNPDLAAKLYQIDTWMAEAGVSSNNTDRSKNYYTVPKEGSGRGSGRGRGSSTGGNISAPVNLRGLNLNSLTATKVNRRIPTVKRLAGRSLTVKPRKITVN